MGLDAYVYCNCYERGTIEVPDAYQGRVQVLEIGCLEIESSDLDEQIQFDAWRHSACRHEDGLVLHHRLGNVASVALLRDELRNIQPRPSFVLDRVVYNGAHAGDIIATVEFPLLKQDLERLRAVLSKRIRHLADCLSELLHCAEQHRKPICF